MASTIIFEERLTIPPIESLADFRRWALSEEFPPTGRIDYIAGQIEVDMSPEDLYTHGTLKAEIASVIHQRTKQMGGQTFIDGTRLSLPVADISTEPDILVVFNQSLTEGRVTRTPKSTGAPNRFVELEGAVDLIVEIVSDSSVIKDLKSLPSVYFASGIVEFWLVDARSQPLFFQIHRRGANGFEPVPPDRAGFQASAVLGKSYRLQATAGEAESIVYDLLEKEPA